MTIEQRVEKLERKNRWMRRIAVLVVVVAGAVLYVKSKRLPILEVSAVQVKTTVDGKTRVLLTGSGIVFYDRKGKTRASLMVYEDGPQLQIQDGGKARATLTTRNLIFSNAKGDVIWQTPR